MRKRTATETIRAGAVYVAALQRMAKAALSSKELYVNQPGQYRNALPKDVQAARIEAAIAKRQRKAQVNFQRAVSGGMSMMQE